MLQSYIKHVEDCDSLYQHVSQANIVNWASKYYFQNQEKVWKAMFLRSSSKIGSNTGNFLVNCRGAWMISSSMLIAAMRIRHETVSQLSCLSLDAVKNQIKRFPDVSS